MRFPRLGALAAFSLPAVLALVAAAAAGDSLTSSEQALHVLNRLGFGPRPGDVERVLSIGVARYVEMQLHPERISDANVETRLSGFETLSLSNSQLFERFEAPLRDARRKLKEETAAEAASGTSSDADGAAQLRKLRESIPPQNRPRRILEELAAARIVRAAESDRQLEEVLVDFWLNHFNVYANKGIDRVLVASFERDTIRPRIWGKFEDLLEATAKSPAMLFYLDNARSVADEEHRPPRAQALLRKDADARRGLNENYARELMELHTLGVDGGYTQKDVTELARILTGWSIGRPQRESQVSHLGSQERTGDFVFRAGMHDVGPKTLLGWTFPAGGAIEEGERALRLLARSPSTARHISEKLCRRLVADEPPAALVERVAETFEKTGGDLRETVRAVVSSPEFFEPRNYRNKIKSPFEYVVSAIRATGASTDGRAAARAVAEMGEPLYLCQPPTGYADTADAWVGSGALLARLNFALSLAEGRVPGTRAGLPTAGGTREPDALARELVGERLSDGTMRAIRQRIDATDQPATASLLAGLILGSPEFQRQ